MKPPARELEILLAVAQGKDYTQIAKKFRMSEMGVRESLVKTRERYGARNNEAAVATALADEDIEAFVREAPHRISQEEVCIIEYIAEGKTDEEMTAVLYISGSTLDRAVKSIMRKLGAMNRPNAVYLSFKYGLLLGHRKRHLKEIRVSEYDALLMMTQTGDIQDAAGQLGIEVTTLKGYLNHAKRRYNVRTTPHAVALAIRRKEIFCPPSKDLSMRSLEANEKFVLVSIAKGMDDPGIAKKLGVSVRTVTRIVASAMQKVNAKSRSHAVFLLFQQRVLS